MVTVTIAKLRFPFLPLATPITASLYIKQYYAPTFTLIESAVPVDLNGNITASPLPTVTIDPTQKYVLRAINELCGEVYDQTLAIYPYCPPGYELSIDDSFCFITSTVNATPPSASENAQAVSGPNNFFYGIFGSLIFDPGYNVNGTGTFTQIPYSNPFWVNGAGYPTFPSLSDTDGPLNRCGVWSATVLAPQKIGFSVCVTLAAAGTYYVGIGCDDFGQINIDGTTIVMQDKNALKAYIQAHGYPYPIGLDPNQVTFNFWYIYPVELSAGEHTIEIIGNNVSGTIAGAADLGCEVYNLTAAQIAAATSYGAMGAGLVFSTKDYIGLPIQLGSGGIGYTCPAGYSLRYCDSPIVCVRTVTTPILY